MQAIKDGFLGIWNMLVMFKDFLVNSIKALFELVKLLTTLASNINNMIQTLPPWLIAVASTTLGICLLYLLVGRETGK
jgi:hypothetical protein